MLWSTQCTITPFFQSYSVLDCVLDGFGRKRYFTHSAAVDSVQFLNIRSKLLLERQVLEVTVLVNLDPISIIGISFFLWNHWSCIWSLMVVERLDSSQTGSHRSVRSSVIASNAASYGELGNGEISCCRLLFPVKRLLNRSKHFWACPICYL